MTRRLSLTLLWLTFTIYAFFLAPPDPSLSLIQQLSTGQWDGIEPLVIALFNLMGIWPLIYSCVLVTDGCQQKIPAWPFAAASFAFGAFAILPYLILREPAPEFSRASDRWLKFWDARLLGIAIAVGAIALLLYGLIQGDWSAFAQQWQASRFIHVMSLDFCLLGVLFPVLVSDDLARRQMKNHWLGITLIPLLGPLIYLVMRSPLQRSADLQGSAEIAPS